MRAIEVRLEVGLSRRFARGAGFLALLVAAVPELGSESVTLSTYYPAPTGVYTKLVTSGNTWLGRDGTSSVSIGANAPSGTATRLSIMNGVVGIGTTDATAPLQVAGSGGGNVDVKVNGRIWAQNGVFLDAAPATLVGAEDSRLLLSNSSRAIYVRSGGRVGVGVPWPTEALDVSEDIIGRSWSMTVNHNP